MIHIPDRPFAKRNLRKFTFTGEALKWFFTEGIHVYKCDSRNWATNWEIYIPEDATFVYAYVNPIENTISLIYEHPSFDEIYEGQVVPEVSICITTGIGVLAEAVKEKSFELTVYKNL